MSRIKNKDDRIEHLNFHSNSSSDSSSFSGNMLGVGKKAIDQENISSDKVKTFISSDRTDIVHIPHASDDEQLKRALPWSSLTSLAIHGIEGFEAVSIDEFQVSTGNSTYSQNESVASSNFQKFDEESFEYLSIKSFTQFSTFHCYSYFHFIS